MNVSLWRWPVLLFAVCALLGKADAQEAHDTQSKGGRYSLVLERAAGGTEQAAADRYRLGATVGQAEAGRHSGGRYRLLGGFRFPPNREPAPETLFRDGFESPP